MKLSVALRDLAGWESEAWRLLFELSEEYRSGWAVVGAQMVILHAAACEAARPTRTRDVDVLVDLRTTTPKRIAEWLGIRDFELKGVSPGGVGHRFVKEAISVDVLAMDHAGERADRRTVPPWQTVEVPGGRTAMGRLTTAEVTAGVHRGTVPVPDWIGALVLKARAAVEFDDGERHLVDLALLLALPVDVMEARQSLSKRERKHLDRAFKRIDDAVWASLPAGLDPREGRAAMRLLLAP